MNNPKKNCEFGRQFPENNSRAGMIYLRGRVCFEILD